MDSSDVTIINNLSHIYFGVQPGATFIAWTGGIITFEALRLIQKFDSKVPIMRRAFVVLTLVMSFLLFGTFGAVKYFYAVDSLVDDPRMLKFKNILDWNLGCSRLAVLSGQSFYTYLLLSSTKDSKIGPGRIIKAICFLLIIGCFGLSLVAVSASSQKIDVFEQRRLAWKM
ncbi:hypothetical protein BY996DRAFT_2331059 [Phakopsora pachyrhizi]|uniref:Expressed protein n=1 Tax=Phakopsora pachyrhizi TaxID=170000 RepID=A0AAV0AJD2_PHAPC|nr:hypothetical protein BY996DRAFT_2331059 [Phakopsora pachyrhizi]CAH7666983.1 expressed protein [Phakopsora pachyrhizi]